MLLQRILRALALVILAVTGVSRAEAQTVNTYTAPADGAVNGSTTCTAPLVRNFTVGPNYVVADVNLGVYVTHTWRGDVRITLQSPSGTRVQLVDGDANTISGDNFNVLLDDSAAQLVNTDTPTAAHSTTAPPPFANTFRPNAALSAFAGQNSAGTWRLEICDIFPSQDNGNFRHAELYLTSAPAVYADLSLAKTVNNSNPTSGSTVTYTLTLANATGSPQTATAITVRDLLPAGATYVSHSGSGTYNPATGNWSVASLAPGASTTLTIQASIAASPGAVIANVAEVMASSVSDLDSTPGNGVTSEDDYGAAPVTVAGARVAGTPPVLTCPAGTNVFDWDARPWTAGSTNNTYAVTNFGNVNFAITTTGAWVTDTNFGGASPSLSNANSGGLPGGQLALHQYLDFTNRSEVATTVITLPNGIAGAQFIVFDVDFAANDFADKLTVTGSYKGVTVFPILTNGVVNYVIGNTAIGDGSSDGTSSNGNVVVTFLQPIDRITVQYGNHTTAPPIPDGQAIAIHDITMCAPFTSLSVTKTSAVFSDPVNNTTNPKAIPGARIEYSIFVSNPGVSSADNNAVVVRDRVPSDAKMCVASIGGAGPVVFTNGATSSGLAYSYVSLSSTTDSLAFSNDGGASWNYVPTADADGCDSAITDFRVIPSGPFASGGSFTLRTRFVVK